MKILNLTYRLECLVLEILDLNFQFATSKIIFFFFFYVSKLTYRLEMHLQIFFPPQL
jgi:hypothetical protein